MTQETRLTMTTGDYSGPGREFPASRSDHFIDEIKKYPSLAKKRLDDCMDTQHGGLSSLFTEKKNCCFITLRFHIFEDKPSESIDKKSYVSREDHPLSLMVKYRHAELLKHPVVKILVNYKWKKYGQPLYLLNLAFFVIFVILLTSFALVVLSPTHPTCVQVLTGGFNGSEPDDCTGLSRSGYDFIWRSAFVITLLTCIRISLELFQFLRQFIHYFKQVTNWLELALYFSTLNFVWIFRSPCFCIVEGQWELGAISVFLSWIVLTLFADKLPLVGLYVVMFISILKTFLKTIVLSLLLIVAFGLVFFMLFHIPGVARSPFGAPFLSIVKTITMSQGEFDFDDNFALEPEGTIAYPNTTFIIWLIFLVLMSLLLQNLLTGLAVGDVKEIIDDANLKRLQLKIHFLLAIDGFISNFPGFLLSWVREKDEITVLVYHSLSIWQKLQLAVLGKNHDFSAPAHYFTSWKVHQDDSDGDRVIPELRRYTEEAEQVKKAVTTLETTVANLIKDNKEMKGILLKLVQQNSEMKQALLWSHDHTHWQRNILSEIALKHDIDPPDIPDINFEGEGDMAGSLPSDCEVVQERDGNEPSGTKGLTDDHETLSQEQELVENRDRSISPQVHQDTSPGEEESHQDPNLREREFQQNPSLGEEASLRTKESRQDPEEEIFQDHSQGEIEYHQGPSPVSGEYLQDQEYHQDPSQGEGQDHSQEYHQNRENIEMKEISREEHEHEA